MNMDQDRQKEITELRMRVGELLHRNTEYHNTNVDLRRSIIERDAEIAALRTALAGVDKTAMRILWRAVGRLRGILYTIVQTPADEVIDPVGGAPRFMEGFAADLNEAGDILAETAGDELGIDPPEMLDMVNKEGRPT